MGQGSNDECFVVLISVVTSLVASAETRDVTRLHKNGDVTKNGNVLQDVLCCDL